MAISTRTRRATAAIASVAAAALVLSGCGSGGDAAQPPPTVPAVTAVPTPTAASMFDAPIVTAPSMFAEMPSSTTVAAAPVTPESIAATVASTSPAPLPAAATTTTAPPRVEPPQCSPAAVSASTGFGVIGLSCRAGWAIGTTASCEAGAVCSNRDVFHVSGDGTGRVGWVHIGAFGATCAEHLMPAGMTLATASYFAAPCGQPQPELERVIRDGDPRVRAVQVALIANGYQIALDGTYGPNTEAAVRSFQSAVGLEVDGLVGPNTQVALGI